ncbi:hemerythrin domain-containing protein [Sphaerisporangium aureirubrum]|uniref:Hemerythrin domain-containing protein n=1 Tax=Sphaerisporangium aureirubrum TaxID=1544736 RepID=A0ABW1NRH9_9ACTN
MMNHAHAADRPYTHEMVVVHRVFRRESGLLPRLVRAVPEGDLARAAEIARHYQDYAEGLYLHHTGEDEMIWPLLHARAEPRAGLVLRMQGQHKRIDETMGRVEDLLPEWLRTASGTSGEALALALESHRAALLEHLDEEEWHVLDLIAEHMSAAEWEAVGRRGLEQIPRNRALIVLGAVLEDATPQERRFYLGRVPVTARLLWHTVGRRRYTRRVRRLRAPLTA